MFALMFWGAEQADKREGGLGGRDNRGRSGETRRIPYGTTAIQSVALDSLLMPPPRSPGIPRQVTVPWRVEYWGSGNRMPPRSPLLHVSSPVHASSNPPAVCEMALRNRQSPSDSIGASMSSGQTPPGSARAARMRAT